MSNNSPIRFSHSHHLLRVKGGKSALDVLAFEGDEALSLPFSYRIEFTSPDHAISKEMMLMKAAAPALHFTQRLQTPQSGRNCVRHDATEKGI